MNQASYEHVCLPVFLYFLTHSSPSQCLNRPCLSDASRLMNETPVNPFAFRSHMVQNLGFDLNLSFAMSENSFLAHDNPVWQ